MSLYLKVSVGEAYYLVAASLVTDVRPVEDEPDDDGAIDCRVLCGTPRAVPGYRIRFAPEAAVSDLTVDRLDGLIELGDAAFRPLPPIGRLGALIDAVALPVAAEPPALRLRIDPALFAAALAAERAR